MTKKSKKPYCPYGSEVAGCLTNCNNNQLTTLPDSQMEVSLTIPIFIISYLIEVNILGTFKVIYDFIRKENEIFPFSRRCIYIIQGHILLCIRVNIYYTFDWFSLFHLHTHNRIRIFYHLNYLWYLCSNTYYFANNILVLIHLPNILPF